MVEKNFCPSCPQGHDCKKAYEAIGRSKGPSIAIKVTFAFLIPLVIFIVLLAVFGRIFAGITDSEGLQTVLGVLSAAVLTLVFMLIAKIIIRQVNKLVWK